MDFNISCHFPLLCPYLCGLFSVVQPMLFMDFYIVANMVIVEWCWHVGLQAESITHDQYFNIYIYIYILSLER